MAADAIAASAASVRPREIPNQPNDLRPPEILSPAQNLALTFAYPIGRICDPI